MSRKRVLVTGAGALLGQGIIRSLLGARTPFDVIACDPNPLSAGLYWTPSRYIIPMATDPSWLKAFSALLARERPDAVMVGTDVELKLLAERRTELEDRFETRIVVSSSDVIAIADDKFLTAQFLKERGFDAPASSLADGVDNLVRTVGFPLVVKPRVGARSVGVYVVRSEVELARALERSTDVVVQECVGTEADEYTAGALCFEGVCGASIVMRRDLRDGNTYRAYVDDYPDLNAFVRRVAEALAPFGPVNFQFRLANGRPTIFEINGRFSGTTPLRMLAGFNEVELVLRYLLFGEAVSQPKVTKMTILRHFTETIVLPDAELHP